MSPDGEHAYAASFTSHALVSFDRDAMTGALTQRTGTDSCVVRTGVVADCVNSAALNGPFALAIAGDGATVAVAAFDGDALVAVDRDASGALSLPAAPNGCVSERAAAVPATTARRSTARPASRSPATARACTSPDVLQRRCRTAARPRDGSGDAARGRGRLRHACRHRRLRPAWRWMIRGASPPRPTDAACTSPRSFPSLSTCSTASRPPPVLARRSRSCTTSPGRSRSLRRADARSRSRHRRARAWLAGRRRSGCADRALHAGERLLGPDSFRVQVTDGGLAQRRRRSPSMCSSRGRSVRSGRSGRRDRPATTARRATMARSVRQGRPVRREMTARRGWCGRPAGVAGTTGATGAAGPAGRDATSLIVGLASTRLRSVAGRRMVVRYVATAAGSGRSSCVAAAASSSGTRCRPGGRNQIVRGAGPSRQPRATARVRRSRRGHDERQRDADAHAPMNAISP